MAPDTYYFFFSIILVLGVILHIANMVYFRVKGKTIVGNRYRPGTPEHATLKRYSSNRYLTIVLMLAMLLVANLALDVNRLLHLSNREYARGILIYAPVSCVLLAVLVLVSAYKKYGNNRLSGRRG